ncbi:hypothetical protein C8R43DRAFT_953601 [Mycena crocata]|nr:hypothetical protein C8R43DRAFT_953601 [Mycena crocata]
MAVAKEIEDDQEREGGTWDVGQGCGNRGTGWDSGRVGRINRTEYGKDSIGYGCTAPLFAVPMLEDADASGPDTVDVNSDPDSDESITDDEESSLLPEDESESDEESHPDEPNEQPSLFDIDDSCSIMDVEAIVLPVLLPVSHSEEEQLLSLDVEISGVIEVYGTSVGSWEGGRSGVGERWLGAADQSGAAGGRETTIWENERAENGLEPKEVPMWSMCKGSSSTGWTKDEGVAHELYGLSHLYRDVQIEFRALVDTAFDDEKRRVVHANHGERQVRWSQGVLDWRAGDVHNLGNDRATLRQCTHIAPMHTHPGKPVEA